MMPSYFGTTFLWWVQASVPAPDAAGTGARRHHSFGCCLNAEAREANPPATAGRATARTRVTLPAREFKTAIEARGSFDDQLFPFVLERSAEMLQMRRHVMLWNADEFGQVVGRDRTIEQGPMNALTHGEVPLHLSLLRHAVFSAGAEARVPWLLDSSTKKDYVQE